jgi:hypothetical protein
MAYTLVGEHLGLERVVWADEVLVQGIEGSGMRFMLLT